MRIAILHIRQQVTWRIAKGTPSVLPVQLGGVTLLNPMLLAQTCRISGPSVVTFPNDNEAVFALSEIGLLDPKSQDLLVNFDQHVTGFLACLEEVSEQNGLSSMSSIAACSFNDIEVPEVLHFPDLGPVPIEGRCKKSYIERAVTVQMMEAAAQMVSQRKWPAIHRELLFDAVDAFGGGDYRMAILLAAMAVETLARSIAELKAPSSNLSQTSMNTNASGSGLSNDAQLERLVENAKRNFELWLHTVPQHVIGKSMLRNSPALHALAMKLHLTRNSIVHEGYPSKSACAKCFNTTYAGASHALEIANDVFSWFGERPVRLEGGTEVVSCGTWITQSLNPLALDYQHCVSRRTA